MSHSGTGPVVSFENVSKHYGSLKAVDGLSLELRARGDRRTARPERRGQVHLARHAPRAAQADRGEDPDVRQRPVPRGQVRPRRRHAPVRRADARGDGPRTGHAGRRAAPAAGSGGHHAAPGRHRGHRRPARGPAVRRPDAARQVLARDRRRVRPDRARRADHGDGRGDQAAVLGADEGRGRRGQDAAVRDPLPGGGRPGRRPHPGDQPGTAARRRHAGRHQEAGRRQADVVPARRGGRGVPARPARAWSAWRPGTTWCSSRPTTRTRRCTRCSTPATGRARSRSAASASSRRSSPSRRKTTEAGGHDRVGRPHADFHEGDEKQCAASCC